MYLSYSYVTRTYQELSRLIRPANADQPECLPWVIYDTQAYAAAGSTTLSFYTAAQADLTLSNIGVGQLDALSYYELHRAFVSILAPLSVTSAGTAAGAANDVAILHFTARGTVTFTMLQKTWGPFPLDFFGRPGGPDAVIAAHGTQAAGTSFQTQLGTTVMNGGFTGYGAIVIAPTTTFRVKIDFVSTAISTQTNIRHSMLGTMHRRVA